MEPDIEDLNRRFAKSSSHDILQWIIKKWYPDLALISSFQVSGLVLIHMIKNLQRRLKIFFIDTGYHFPETLEFMIKLEKKWKLNIVRVRASKEPERSRTGGRTPLYERNPDLCCRLHKVEPLRRIKKEMNVTRWISAIRQDQSDTRSNHRLFMRDEDGHVRVHPMIHWTREQVWEYIVRHRLPYHPLYDQGYTSIGCFPPSCTSRNASPQEERAGRWAGTGKKECGLHLFTDPGQNLRDDDKKKGESDDRQGE